MNTDFEYELTGRTVEICGYIGSSLALVIPDTVDGLPVTSVNDYAFARGAFTSAYIPAGITSMGWEIFTECTSLTRITVAPDNPCFSSENGVLFNKDKTELLCYPAGKPNKTYRVPDGVVRFGDNAFARNTSLEKVALPDSAAGLCMYMFMGCTALTDVHIPDSVSYISFGAFAGCAALAELPSPRA